MDNHSFLFNQVEIVYQDDEILVVNKPANLLTITDGYDPTQPCLKRFLETEFGKVWIVHRLDKPTSGLIVFARDAETHRFLSKQFENRKVEKKYYCYGVGLPEWKNLIADFPLKVNADKKHRTLVNLETGKPAKTVFNVLKQLSFVSFVESNPYTGYTHQIRSHLFSLGFPIFGDELYGFRDQRYQEKIPENIRIGYDGFLMLCAKEISLSLPSNNQRATFTISLPKHFSDFANLLS